MDARALKIYYVYVDQILEIHLAELYLRQM